jgi:hypothetical protein
VENPELSQFYVLFAMEIFSVLSFGKKSKVFRKRER